MRTIAEGLPDGSSWYSILHGPIVLASATGSEDQMGLFAGDGRSAHIAQGPLEPLDKMPALLTGAADLPRHVVTDPAVGPMHFRLIDVSVPGRVGGIPLEPFFKIQESRYQMVWDLTTPQGLAERKARLAEEERQKLARDAATIDRVAIGEQQPEVDHDLKGEGMETGIYNGRRWRHGRTIQYTLDAHGAKAADLAVDYSGDDSGREFDIFADGILVATQKLTGDRHGKFFEVRYPIPASVFAASLSGKLTVKFVAKQVLAGGLYDVRLLRPDPTKN
jgi:hypothetical protein